MLGVCVGMQILFARGVEFGVESQGCGQWPGAVVRLDAPVIPHMGWNVVDAPQAARCSRAWTPTTRFYFVHSYAAQQWEGNSGRAADLGDPSRAVPGRRRGRRRWPPPSSTRRRAATRVRRCSRNWVEGTARLTAVRALILLPAVDVVDGKAVRLVQGQAGSETDYGSALDAAMTWQRDGAEWIHLVDLDAAFGRGSNRELLAEVVGKLDVAVELSGRHPRRRVAGGRAGDRLRPGQPRHRGAGEPAVVRPGRRRARRQGGRRAGRARSSTASTGCAAAAGRPTAAICGPVLERLDSEGCSRFVVTDVTKDGTLTGPNLDLLSSVAERTDAPVIASGGVSSLDDLRAIATLTDRGVEGAIIGKALYAGRFTLPQALAAVAQ